MDLSGVYGGGQAKAGGGDRIERILALSARLQAIQKATDQIRYDNELVTALPEVLRTLGDAKDAVIAELKTV
jgi:hypothetical protein